MSPQDLVSRLCVCVCIKSIKLVKGATSLEANEPKASKIYICPQIMITHTHIIVFDILLLCRVVCFTPNIIYILSYLMSTKLINLQTTTMRTMGMMMMMTR